LSYDSNALTQALYNDLDTTYTQWNLLFNINYLQGLFY
jgi:hypothetical protein